MKNKSARRIALETLISVFKNKSYSNIALNHALKNSGLSSHDKNLVTQLVYGTIQHQIYLDYQIHDIFKENKKAPWMRPLLLMSVYQLFFLDRVPNHAVLDEANLLAKEYTKNNLYKVVNGVLRNVIRRGQQKPSSKNPVSYLSTVYSIPEWLVEYFVTHFGQEKAESILQSINQPPQNTIRINQKVTTKAAVCQWLDEQGINYTESEISPDSLHLSYGPINQLELFETGAITIQDDSATLAAQSLRVQPGDNVLDACASPGGKTIQIAEELTTGTVTALDIHKNKLNLIKDNATRLQVADLIETQQLDARLVSQELGTQIYDKILVDAPCSGLGLLRRKPEVKYTKAFSDVQKLSQIQLAILNGVCESLKPNGRLVYSTCTITDEENEQVVQAFLAQHPEFSLEKVYLKADNEAIRSGDFVRIFPDTYRTDGFFIASLVKSEGEQ
ncbi:16S rRNA (cytosine(967)-C(5))-methyltransferase RsmB [Holzapfeliella sp. He02]|uniref:16S rRNA (cytosine(967)-C(5))-methyltransferase n=1 Tax=Holzapfeliella saturejae TaxID=3082953 RepID=A0ABU8SGS6_9LACO